MESNGDLFFFLEKGGTSQQGFVIDGKRIEGNGSIRACDVKMNSVIGGWGCDTVVRPHPNREIDFDCVCVACVRAKLCA